MFSDLVRAVYIAKKDIKEYYLKPGSVSWGLIFPFVFSLAFMVRRGGVSVWLAPGMISLALFFGSTSMSAMAIVFERRIGSFERLLLFPVSYICIALGKSLSSFTLGVLSSIPVLILAGLLVPTPPTYPSLLALSIILATFTSSTLGVLISFLIKDPSQTMTIFNIIRFPMMFLSNIVIPVSTFPAILKFVSLLLPLTYITEAVRYAYSGTYDIMHPEASFTITLILGLIFLYLASVIIKKSIP